MLVTTDRQSAFDRVLASIPFKGQVNFIFGYILNMFRWDFGDRRLVNF